MVSVIPHCDISLLYLEVLTNAGYLYFNVIMLNCVNVIYTSLAWLFIYITSVGINWKLLCRTVFLSRYNNQMEKTNRGLGSYYFILYELHAEVVTTAISLSVFVVCSPSS
jgi:hypothetical protein